jgi:hypothetical protein
MSLRRAHLPKHLRHDNDEKSMDCFGIRPRNDVLLHCFAVRNDGKKQDAAHHCEERSDETNQSRGASLRGVKRRSNPEKLIIDNRLATPSSLTRLLLLYQDKRREINLFN